MPLARLTDGVDTVEFSVVETENPVRNNDITENPVETGQDVADHVRSKPIRFSINGVIVGEDAASKLSIIEKFRTSGALLTYIGRNYITNLVVETFSSTHDGKVANGFQFNIAFKQVRITTKKTVEIVAPTVSPTQVKPTENKGRQQKKNKLVDEETTQELIAKMRQKVGRSSIAF